VARTQLTPAAPSTLDCEKVLVIGKDALLAGAGKAREILEPHLAKRAAD
jgi:hypothetical protein